MPLITFITNGGKVVTAPDNSNLLRVSLRERGGIPFKCGGGLCGTCKCLIEFGLEHTVSQAEGAQAPERRRSGARPSHGLPDLRQRRRERFVGSATTRLVRASIARPPGVGRRSAFGGGLETSFAAAGSVLRSLAEACGTTSAAL